MMSPPFKIRHPAYRGSLRLTLTLLAPVLFGIIEPQLAHPAVGSVLFSDNFESGFGNWSTTDTNLSGINNFTSSSPSRSLFTRGTAVTTTSIAIDTRVPAIQVEAWIRAGSDLFGEEPDSGEDLVFEFLDVNRRWVTFETYSGSEPPGAVKNLRTTLPFTALHALFQVRVRQTGGSGGPPSNGGVGYDYWHIDDLRIVEVAPPVGLSLNSCEEFEAGLGSWTTSGNGLARITTQTANTPSSSLAINGDAVSVTSTTIDLSIASNLRLDPWIRHGSDQFSEYPDFREDFVIEFLDAQGSWVLLASYPGGGTPGQIFQPTLALPAAAAHSGFQLRFRLLAGSGSPFDFWHVDSVCLSGDAVVAEWRFEEPNWNGTPGELQDSTGNLIVGTAVGLPKTSTSNPALVGDPGTCAYADLNGKSDGFEIPHNDLLLGSDALTYTAWIHPRSWKGARQVMAKSVHGGGSGKAQMGIFSSGNQLLGRAETAGGREEVAATLPAVDQWSHVALVFSGSRLAIYLDGAEVAASNFTATTLLANTDPLAIGRRVGSNSYFFDGLIDEVRVYASALDLTAVRGVAQETHHCPNAVLGFLISHDGNAVHCQRESISVSVRDAGGNLITGHTGTVTLDTQSGTGTWTLVSGGGSFIDATADDGLAQYTFVRSDSGAASFALLYTQGAPSIDIDTYSGSSRDDDSEGALVFSPSALTLTSNAVPNPPPAVLTDPIPTQTAGQSFPIHLAAYGTTPAHPECGIIESYDGVKPLGFWIQYSDPNSGTIVPLIDAIAAAASEISASPQSVRFTLGQAVVRSQYDDAGRISIGVRDLSASPTTHTIRGSTNAFVSQPADLAVIQVANSTAVSNPGGTAPGDALFARAGEPLSIVVEAQSLSGRLTPNFGREAIPESIRLRSATLLAPSGGRNGSTGTGALLNPTSFTPIAPAGTFQSSRVAFDEVGSISLEASVADEDFLGSGAVVGSLSPAVGRFAPDRFEVAANTPRFDTACSLGAFTWVGQPFSYVVGEEPVVSVTAISAAGTPTENYEGAWWRLTNASLSPRSYAAGAATLDTSGLLGPGVDPNIVSLGKGTGTLTFSSGTGLRIARTAPVAPFDAEIELSLDIVDLDATAYASNPLTLGGLGDGSGIGFDVSKRFQWGRIRFDNAFGSELVDLPMRLRTQSFDGVAFADDGNDSCSQIPVSALALTPTPGSLSSAATITNSPLLSGDSGLILGAPSAEGRIAIVVDLSAGGANLPWLRFDWPEDGLDGLFDDDARAQATFGIWSGRDSMIYVREVY